MHQPSLTIALPNGVSFGLILVEGSTFLMGSEASEGEKPVHKVVSSSYYLGKYPVTQSLWKAVMGIEYFPFGFQGDRRPAERVSWYDAIVFCNRLSEQQSLIPFYYVDPGFRQVYGKTDADWELPNKGEVFLKPAANGFRLPMEAEWEYAARGGKKSEGFEYAGSNLLKEVGWYRDNSYGETRSVSMKAPNELGLFDMSGNVLEWCHDWYSTVYYEECHKQDIVENPRGPAEGTDRVMRGGSWGYDPQFCRCTARFPRTPRGVSN